MPDSTPALAQQQVAELAKLQTVAAAADDSTLLRYRYMRGKAIINAGHNKAGCDSLNSIQGKLERSQALKRASKVLLDACAP